MDTEDLTRLLCRACQTIEDSQDFGWATWNDPDWLALAAWWEAYLEADRAVKAREAAQAQQQALYEAALAKLTPEERRILGL
jgi:hypothetical protein